MFEDGKIILVRQFRYLCDRFSLEFPCGSVKEGSTYDETARMELAEEAGVVAGRIEEIGTFNPYNGITDELCKIYLATQLSPTRSSPDETEEFERIFLTQKEIERKIDAGEIWDGMTLAAWLIAQKQIGLRLRRGK